MYAGLKVSVTVDDSISLSVGDPWGILDQQFMPRPIRLLNIVVKLIRVNKLPVTAGWQHQSRICFAAFIYWKSAELLITKHPLKLEEKISADLESLELKKIDVGLAKFKNDKILLYEISHRFLLTTKLFIGWKILIKTSFVTLAPLFCGGMRDNKVEWDLMASKTFTPFNFNQNSCLLYLFLRTFLLPLRRITLQILFKHRLTCQWLVQLIFFWS